MAGRRANRSYKRDEGIHRDARLFIIVCEGKEREPQYFEALTEGAKRIRVKLLPPEEREGSAPKWMLDRAATYLEEHELDFNPDRDGDELIFVLDVDCWVPTELHELASTCKDKAGWSTSISNPCFEVWLGYHFNPENLNLKACRNYKPVVGKMVNGGFRSSLHAQTLVQTAITNASVQDPTPAHYMPLKGVTKMYQLAEKLKS